MSKQTIITFSGQAQHGKSSAAQITKKLLEQCGKRVVEINYADQLKYLARQYFGWDGEKDEKGRTLLQQLGTEKVRSKNPDFWVDTVIRIVKILEDDFDYILIADARFPNEIQRWEEEGYRIIPVHVRRIDFDNGLTDEQKNHPSETALSGYAYHKYLEASNLDELKKEIKEKLRPLFVTRLTVLCDLDDVLWDLITPWTQKLNGRYQTSVAPVDITNWNICEFFPSLTRPQVFGVLDEDGFWDNVELYNDSIWFIEQLLKNGHKIKIVTKSHYKNIKQKAERFLRCFPMLNWGDVTITESKQDIAGDVLVDDYKNNLIGGNYYKILMTRPHNKSFNKRLAGVHRINSLTEAYEVIKTLAEKESICR